MQWRTIPGHPAYEISERGRIRKADTGYVITVRGTCAQLATGGAVVRVPVAELVAAAFRPRNGRAPIAPRTSAGATAGPVGHCAPAAKRAVEKKDRSIKSLPLRVQAPVATSAVQPQAAPEPDEAEWRPLEHFPGLEINRRGEVREIATRLSRVRCRESRSGSVPFVQIQVDKASRTSCVNVLLEETFGPGAAADAGYPAPDMDKAERVRRQWNGEEPEPPKNIFVRPGRSAAKRRCHDCGRPTTNYRCEACWSKIRAVGADSYDPINW